MFAAVIEFFETIIKHGKTIWRLSVHQFFTKNRDTKLGFLWHFLSPLLIALVYWVVFGIGFKNGAAHLIGNGTSYDYLSWMFSGVFPFFYFRSNISEGVNAIYSKYTLVSRARFPVLMLPVVSTLTNLLIYLPTFILPVVQLLISGDFSASPSILLFLYFILASVVHFTALSVLLSVLGMISRDFQRVMRPVLRMLMYFSPVVWSVNGLHESFVNIVKLNPLYHLFEVFRASFLVDYPMDWSFTWYFWGYTVVVFLLGCLIHAKKKDTYYTHATR
ncbi:MAG: ABC transporter permease [Clostridia bacterium]|nr:ABC transporter permease [Clostridia bacterium]